MADIAGNNGERKEFNAVGRANVPGKLSHSLAGGNAKFGTDVIVPNMLYAKFLRSPYAHARVKSIDASKANALPGVVAVIPWDDPELKVLGGGAGIGGAGGLGLLDEMGAPMIDDTADMEDEEVRAIVVAESEELCDQALALLKIDWEVLPHIVDPREGKKPDAPVIRPLPGGKGNVENANRKEGDLEAGFKEADQIIEFDPRAIFTPVGGGSDGTTAAAWVAKEAAVACRKLLLQAAADNLRAKPEDLDVKDSKIFLKSNPSRSFPFSRFSGKDTAATFTGRPPASLWSAGMGKMLDTMNALFCEVAVDTETGAVEVLRHVIAADPGKILRRTSLEGQFHQVMMFSEGTQLKEDFVFDKTTGVKLHTNMFEYKKPTILDIAPVDPVLLETRAGNAAYGVNRISHSLANTHAIICAIQNAIDRWVDPPATPDRILKALGKA